MKKSFVYPILFFTLLFSACQPAQGTVSPQSTAPSTPTSVSPATAGPQLDVSPTAEPASVTVLDGSLTFDQFVEDSFRLLLLRDPEAITMEGLSDILGVRNDRLNDLSISYIQETFALQRVLYDELLSYDRAALTPAQRVTYDTYAWYLDDLIRGQEFLYNDYPVNQMYILGVQYVTEYLFTDYHPLVTLDDAQDYITRLSLVKPKFEQLIAALEQRKQAGILAPRFVFEWSLGDINAIAGSDAAETSFYTSLHDKLAANSAFTVGQRDQLEQQALDAITASVLPAYQMLADALNDLMKDAPTDDGIWQFDNGAAYYAYVLHHFTSTDMTVDEIHQLGLSELDRIHAEMRQAFELLGHPADDNLSSNYYRVAGESGLLQGEQVVQRYESLIVAANKNLSSAFDIFPQASVKVDRIPAGAAFYSAAALDGTRPGIFYAPVGGQQPIYNMATVAYHEAIPGHHFQIALQREMDLPLMRNLVVFNAFTEGWALYAERLAYEMGWYADDPYGNLGRLQYEAHRAARLVVDTGIHVKGWTFDQAVNFMVENTGLPKQAMQSEVARYIVWPGQATSYYIGYMKLLELRQQAQTQLGDAFDLVEFHHLILQTGSVPLDVLEDVVTAWLAEK